MTLADKSIGRLQTTRSHGQGRSEAVAGTMGSRRACWCGGGWGALHLHHHNHHHLCHFHVTTLTFVMPRVLSHDSFGGDKIVCSSLPEGEDSSHLLHRAMSFLSLISFSFESLAFPSPSPPSNRPPPPLISSSGCRTHFLHHLIASLSSFHLHLH